jgi:hypothetical protein
MVRMVAMQRVRIAACIGRRRGDFRDLCAERRSSLVDAGDALFVIVELGFDAVEALDDFVETTVEGGVGFVETAVEIVAQVVDFCSD